ncbi:ion transporter [Falsiroseomonas bella]|uniref:Ion transporter n=1 Tax=Falsiroseomonas bella TaxID=2184016 RepID=A0A317FGY6_9PROT|nr:ion transporter [Falsiroseomonas bella]PWS38330.1 ion transporter [Falsiroseomonas bella]
MQEVLTRADQGVDTRARLARVILSPLFQRTVVGLILLNAVTLGLETSNVVMASWGGLLLAIDRVLLVIFTAEIALRIYAFRGRFFRDPWGIFDLLVVGIAWLPATGPLSVLRALRVLRVLRLVSVVPSLRNVVEAMLAALPGMGSIVLLMLLIFYVAAVMAVKLFGGAMPEQFGDLGTAFFTLFQLMAMDDFGNVVREAMEHSPLAWLFFIPFSVVATFVVLNLFIGVIVESIQTLREQRESADAAAAQVATEAARSEAHLDAQTLLTEIRALRAEVRELRAARQG